MKLLSEPAPGACISVAFGTELLHGGDVKSSELKRWLRKQGCTFQPAPGGSGHLFVLLGRRRSIIPMHGANKDLGTGLVQKILKELGLKK